MLETVPASTSTQPHPPSHLNEMGSLSAVDWTPLPMAPALSRRRTYRWTLVVVALLLGAVGAFGLVAASRAPAQAADARLDAFRSLAGDIRSSLERVDRSLEHGLVPDSTHALRLGGLSDELTGLSSQPNPWAVVVDTGHDLDRVHDQGFLTSATVADVAAQLTAIQRYLAGATGLIVLPALPAEATGPEIAELDAALTISLGQSGARVAALPDTASMDTHRVMAIETIAWLAEWREPYLEALRSGAPDAGDRLAAAQARVTGLETALEDARATGLTELRGPVADALAAVAALELLAG